jgi:drug/metabolite transporter (DMT)-like permease
MQQRDERKAILSGMTFAVVVGFAFVANKAALANGGLYDVLAYRFLFAIIVLPVILHFRKLSLKIPVKDIPAMLVLSATYVLFLFFQLRQALFTRGQPPCCIFVVHNRTQFCNSFLQRSNRA